MKTDVLIVGGGLAGLALAQALAEQGTDFLLVEAQERLGGRILTKELSGGKFDLGPAWFWPGQPRMAALAQRLSIPIFAQYATGELVFQDQSGAVQRGRGYASMEGSYRLAGGMGALIDGLAGMVETGRVFTQTRLRSVQHGNGAITAILKQHSETIHIEAQQIVLAIPPRVIGDTVTFDPPLAATQTQSLMGVPTWMAGQAKIIAVYDSPHWRAAGLSGDAMSHRGPMVELHDASPYEGGPYALFGFVGTPPPVRVAHEDELMQLARAQLIDMFGPQMATPSDLVLRDWARIPEISRAADQKPVGHHPTYSLPANLRVLLESGIHFGSTETAEEFGGYLEGALEAAEQVLARLTAKST